MKRIKIGPKTFPPAIPVDLPMRGDYEIGRQESKRGVMSVTASEVFAAPSVNFLFFFILTPLFPIKIYRAEWFCEYLALGAQPLVRTPSKLSIGITSGGTAITGSPGPLSVGAGNPALANGVSFLSSTDDPQDMDVELQGAQQYSITITANNRQWATTDQGFGRLNLYWERV